MAAASGNGPSTSAPHEAIHPVSMRWIIRGQPPQQGGYGLYWDWEGIPLKTLQCCDDDAAAGGNGLILPHMRHCVSCCCIKLTGEDHLSKRLCIYGGLERVYDLHNDPMHCCVAQHWSVLRAIDHLQPPLRQIRLLKMSSLSI